jgi:hypothetical protein
MIGSDVPSRWSRHTVTAKRRCGEIPHGNA